MMGRTIGKWSGAGALTVAIFFLIGCEKPQLRTEKPEESEEEKREVAEEESAKNYREIREDVIGRKFETLTLGSRRFADAEVRDITDEVIVVAHAGGMDEVSWSDVPFEVRERWGYDPSVHALAEKETKEPPEAEEPSGPGVGKEKTKTAETSGESRDAEPEMTLQERANELARRRKRMEAQQEGIRSIESELARHSQRLRNLRGQLRSLRARASRQRSGEIRVERVEGKSTVVDPGKKIGKVEARIEVEEQLVTQLSKSLEAAKKEYREMRAAVAKLRR